MELQPSLKLIEWSLRLEFVWCGGGCRSYAWFVPGAVHSLHVGTCTMCRDYSEY